MKSELEYDLLFINEERIKKTIFISKRMWSPRPIECGYLILSQILNLTSRTRFSRHHDDLVLFQIPHVNLLLKLDIAFGLVYYKWIICKVHASGLVMYKLDRITYFPYFRLSWLELIRNTRSFAILLIISLPYTIYWNAKKNNWWSSLYYLLCLMS